MLRPPTLEAAPPDMDMPMMEALTSKIPFVPHSAPSPPLSPVLDNEPMRCLLVVVTKEHRVSYSNTAAKMRLSLVRGDALESVVHSLALTQLLPAFEKICAKPHEVVEPFDVCHRDGSVFICNMEPVLEDQRVSAVAIYLYPRRSTTPEFRVDVDKLYGPMLDALKQPILAVSNNGHILHLNAAARTQLGFSQAELRGIDAGKIIFGVDGDSSHNSNREEEIVKHTLAGVGEWRGQVSTRAKHSSHLQRSVMCATPLRGADGSVIGSVRTLEALPYDASRPLKRSRFEPFEEPSADPSSKSGSPVPNRLYEDMSLLQNVREQMISAVVIVNSEGLVDWATDSKWLESIMHGVTPREAHGKPAAEFLCGQPVDVSAIGRVQEAIKTHQALDAIIPQLPLDTSVTRNLHLLLSPVFNADGSIRHTIANLRDIDLDRQASEEALASKLRLEFFNTLSHELKTPLKCEHSHDTYGIIGASGVVLRTLQLNNGSSELKGNMETILSCAEVLSTLINNLIDYRKIEANKLELQRIPLDVRATFRGAVAQCEALAHQKSMTINTILPASLPQYVACDPLRITQVTVNLVLNAIKYSPPGRSVNVVIAALASTQLKDVCKLVVSVEDHGIGISEDKLARLFQVHPDAPESGAGLGLRICKKLAERMGGGIEVQSKLGEGTKFTYHVEVGLVSDAQAHFLARERALTPHENFSILIVEDNVLNQKVLLRILQQLGYSADVAADGRQAIEMAAKHSYDLILMDIAMPVMNGLDATRYIFRNWDEEHRPVIVGVTANAVTKELNEYIKAGMSDCVTKPVTMAKVVAILQSAREADKRKEPRRGSC